MATLWNVVIRQILLQGDFFAGNAAAVKALYDITTFTDTQITKSGAEFPFKAIGDAALQAMTIIVSAIGHNRESQYRPWFQDVTDTLADGVTLPKTGSSASGSKQRFGKIGKVKDGSNSRICAHSPKEMVRIADSSHGRFNLNVYRFWTDDVTIHHNRTDVVAECVTWDRATELTYFIANNANNCSLPDELIPDLVIGALAFIHKDTFRGTEWKEQWALFAEKVNRIAGDDAFADAYYPAKT
jgi:hypothetical protein